MNLLEKKRNIAINIKKSKRFILKFIGNITYFLLLTTFVISCSNSNNSKNEILLNVKNDKNPIQKKISITSIGYGDSKNSAINDAKNECVFKAYGSIKTNKAGELIIQNNGKCVSYTLLSESKDEIGMWTIKIKAEVIEKI